jgi:hypothetical protein
MVGRKLSWTTVNTLDLVEPLTGVLSMNNTLRAAQSTAHTSYYSDGRSNNTVTIQPEFSTATSYGPDLRLSAPLHHP